MFHFKKNKKDTYFNTLKLTSITSVSKLTALELRKQSLIPQSSSQEAVDTINKVLNPPVTTNLLQFQCDECAKSFSTPFGLCVHKRSHNKKNKC